MTRRSERKAPAVSIPKVKAGMHAAHLYGDAAAAEEAVAFLAEGLASREACAVLSYARHGERLAAQLRDLHAVDVKRSTAEGALVFLEARETGKELHADLSRFLEKSRKARRPARLLLNLGWREEGWPDDDDLLWLEAGMSELCEEHDAAALCLYDARQLPGSILLDGALGCHPVVFCRGAAVKNPFLVDPATLNKELTARRKGEAGLRSWMA
ncbi:MAG: MEDS domain-containing protein [Myxococcales bacterium]